MKKKSSSAKPTGQINATAEVSAVRFEEEPSRRISPMQALQFLEDMRVLAASKDEPTRAISLRVPENILRLLKTRAESEGKKYQSLMIELFRQGLHAKATAPARSVARPRSSVK